MLFKKAVSIFVAKPVRMDIPQARVADIRVVDAIHNLKKAGLNFVLADFVEWPESLCL